jgi:tryptophanyl-tRNA synthetase
VTQKEEQYRVVKMAAALRSLTARLLSSRIFRALSVAHHLSFSCNPPQPLSAQPLRLPEALIVKDGARVMSLLDGTSKMSKSADNDNSRINLLDPPEVGIFCRCSLAFFFPSCFGVYF